MSSNNETHVATSTVTIPQQQNQKEATINATTTTTTMASNPSVTETSPEGLTLPNTSEDYQQQIYYLYANADGFPNQINPQSVICIDGTIEEEELIRQGAVIMPYEAIEAQLLNAQPLDAAAFISANAASIAAPLAEAPVAVETQPVVFEAVKPASEKAHQASETTEIEMTENNQQANACATANPPSQPQRRILPLAPAPAASHPMPLPHVATNQLLGLFPKDILTAFSMTGLPILPHPGTIPSNLANQPLTSTTNNQKRTSKKQTTDDNGNKAKKPKTEAAASAPMRTTRSTARKQQLEQGSSNINDSMATITEEVALPRARRQSSRKKPVSETHPQEASLSDNNKALKTEAETTSEQQKPAEVKQSGCSAEIDENEALAKLDAAVAAAAAAAKAKSRAKSKAKGKKTQQQQKKQQQERRRAAQSKDSKKKSTSNQPNEIEELRSLLNITLDDYPDAQEEPSTHSTPSEADDVDMADDVDDDDEVDEKHDSEYELDSEDEEYSSEFDVAAAATEDDGEGDSPWMSLDDEADADASASRSKQRPRRSSRRQQLSNKRHTSATNQQLSSAATVGSGGGDVDEGGDCTSYVEARHRSSKRTTPHPALGVGNAGGMSFMAAAYEVLKRSDRPMSVIEIFNTIMREKLVITNGQTPKQTLASRLYSNIKDPNPIFKLIRQGVFGLAERSYDHISEEELDKAVFSTPPGRRSRSNRTSAPLSLLSQAVESRLTDDPMESEQPNLNDAKTENVESSQGRQQHATTDESSSTAPAAIDSTLNSNTYQLRSSRGNRSSALAEAAASVDTESPSMIASVEETSPAAVAGSTEVLIKNQPTDDDKPKPTTTFLNAATRIVQREMRPMSAKEIFGIIDREKWVTTAGKTPLRTLMSRLYSESKRKDGAFRRIGRNLFWLTGVELTDEILERVDADQRKSIRKTLRAAKLNGNTADPFYDPTGALINDKLNEDEDDNEDDEKGMEECENSIDAGTDADASDSEGKALANASAASKEREDEGVNTDSPTGAVARKRRRVSGEKPDTITSTQQQPNPKRRKQQESDIPKSANKSVDAADVDDIEGLSDSEGERSSGEYEQQSTTKSRRQIAASVYNASNELARAISARNGTTNNSGLPYMGGVKLILEKSDRALSVKELLSKLADAGCYKIPSAHLLSSRLYRKHKNKNATFKLVARGLFGLASKEYAEETQKLQDEEMPKSPKQPQPPTSQHSVQRKRKSLAQRPQASSSQSSTNAEAEAERASESEAEDSDLSKRRPSTRSTLRSAKAAKEQQQEQEQEQQQQLVVNFKVDPSLADQNITIMLPQHTIQRQSNNNSNSDSSNSGIEMVTISLTEMSTKDRNQLSRLISKYGFVATDETHVGHQSNMPQSQQDNKAASNESIESAPKTAPAPTAQWLPNTPPIAMASSMQSLVSTAPVEAPVVSTMTST